MPCNLDPKTHFFILASKTQDNFISIFEFLFAFLTFMVSDTVTESKSVYKCTQPILSQIEPGITLFCGAIDCENVYRGTNSIM